MKENMEAAEHHQSWSDTMIFAEAELPFWLQCTVEVRNCGDLFLEKLESK